MMIFACVTVGGGCVGDLYLQCMLCAPRCWLVAGMEVVAIGCHRSVAYREGGVQPT